MSTPMIDFDHFDITAIVRNSAPLQGVKTVIFCSDTSENMSFFCTEEEHEKLVADFLAWKTAKDKVQAENSLCSVGKVDENIDDLATKMARDCDFTEPKKTPPMPHPFKVSHLAQNITPAVKIEEIEGSPPIPKPMLTPEQIMLNRREHEIRNKTFVVTIDGDYQITVKINTLLCCDIDSAIDRIMNGIGQRYRRGKNTDADFIKNRIIFALAESISSMN